MADQLSNAAFVDAWIERTDAKGLPRDVLLELFQAALIAVWARTSNMLGDVTLTAIAERVLFTAAERYPAFAALKVEPNGRIQTRDLRGNDSLYHMKLLEGMRFVLVELLTVLGNLSAELLTPELRAELASVAPDSTEGGKPRQPTKAAAKSSQRNR